MELTTTQKITLDFYNNHLVTVTAKQYDTKARFLNVSCTEHGRKIVLDAETTSAFVRYKKPDGHAVFNDAKIQTDGTVLVELTQQMLSCPGKSMVDIVLVYGTNIKVEQLVDISSIYELGVSVLSTMTFCLNIQATAIEYAELESTYEHNTILTDLARALLIEKNIQTAISDAQDTTADATTATSRANSAAYNAEKAIANVNTAINNAENATIEANTATENAEIVTALANTSANNADIATQRANDAAELCESVIDGSGLVLQTEKGVANGIATLNSDAKIPSEQLNITNNLTTEIMGTLLDASQGKALKDLIDAISITLEALPQIHYGENTPSDSLGKNGDIYMQIIG